MHRLVMFLGVAVGSVHAQAVPPSLLGKWRVVKIIPTHNDQCWDEARAKTMLGSILTYQPHAMVWSGGSVDIAEALSRTQTRRSFQDEYQVSFDELGIKAASVTEIDLQHEDADVTGATTEIPGDTILLAGPGRILVSACRVYYEAVRVPAR